MAGMIPVISNYSSGLQCTQLSESQRRNGGSVLSGVGPLILRLFEPRRLLALEILNGAATVAKSTAFLRND